MGPNPFRKHQNSRRRYPTYSYETLEFDDESHEITNEGETNDSIDDYDENIQIDLRSDFTIQEMKVIMNWVDKHPNAGFSIISNRFRKAKQPNYVSKFRKCIENDGYL